MNVWPWVLRPDDALITSIYFRFKDISINVIADWLLKAVLQSKRLKHNVKYIPLL
jgi:hypothetical protein